MQVALRYERTIVRYLDVHHKRVKHMAETEQRVHPRKIEITYAAVACFIEQGYHQTGVRDIARQAGVSLGNLYNHFKGKEDILGFIAELDGKEVAGFVDILSDGSDPKATLKRFVHDYAAHAALPENALLGVEILAEALRTPMIAEIFGKNRTRLEQALVTCLETGAKTGAFSSEMDQQLAACMILDTLEGHGLRLLAKQIEVEQSSSALWALIFKGVRP